MCSEPRLSVRRTRAAIRRAAVEASRNQLLPLPAIAPRFTGEMGECAVPTGYVGKRSKIESTRADEGHPREALATRIR